MERAFTLVELLVVITIIAVLLALLAPALDKAVYEAELSVCAGNMDGAVSALHVYAAEHRRQYPYRGSVQLSGNTQQHILSHGNLPERDLRPVIRDYIPINKFFLDPTCPKVDLEGSHARTVVYTNYDLWFGWRFSPPGEKGMFRLGDRWTHTNQTVVESFSLLISDRNVRTPGQWSVASSHDDLGILRTQVVQDVSTLPEEVRDFGVGSATTASFWQANADRGRIDMNHGYEDGSVDRLRNVEPIDRRTTGVPSTKTNSDPARLTYIWRK